MDFRSIKAKEYTIAYKCSPKGVSYMEISK